MWDVGREKGLLLWSGPYKDSVCCGCMVGGRNDKEKWVGGRRFNRRSDNPLEARSRAANF